MDKTRWRELRAKGWTEGSVAAFLGLSPEEAILIELKLRMARTVRELRRRRGLTQVELAERLGSSQSRVAKLESGDPSVSMDLLTRSLLALGATSRELSRAIAG